MREPEAHAVGINRQATRVEALGVTRVEHHVVAELPAARKPVGVGVERDVPGAPNSYTVVDSTLRELYVRTCRLRRRDSGRNARRDVEPVLLGRLLWYR